MMVGIPYETCRLWRLLELCSGNGVRKHAKSITFIDKAHRGINRVEIPYKTNGNEGSWGAKTPKRWNSAMLGNSGALGNFPKTFEGCSR